MSNLIAEAFAGNVENVRKLVNEDSKKVHEVDDAGDSALHAAVAKGHINVANILISKGANVNLRNKVGSTPLHKAVTSERSAVLVKVLLEANADSNIRNAAGLLPEDLTSNSKLKESLMGKDAVEVQLHVPRERHGAIIGRGGKVLENLRAETKCIITVPPPGDATENITIKGRQANIEAAKEKIQSIVSDSSAQDAARQKQQEKRQKEIDEKRKQYEELKKKRLEREDAARKRELEKAQRESEKIRRKEELKRLKEEEMKKREEERKEREKDYTHAKVPVPKDKHGLIIGKGGQNIKELQLLGVRIVIPDKSSTETNVEVIGPDDVIQEAVERMLEFTNRPVSNGGGDRPPRDNKPKSNKPRSTTNNSNNNARKNNE